MTTSYENIDRFINDPSTTTLTVVSSPDYTFVTKIESCFYLKKHDFICALLEDAAQTEAKLTAQMRINILRYTLFETFMKYANHDTSEDPNIIDIIIAIAGTQIDVDAKVSWLCDLVAKDSLSIVDDLNNAITSKNHKYNKNKYRNKITSLALKCMGTYDYAEMIQNPEYTLLCAHIVDNQPVEDSFELLKQTVAIDEYENFRAILNKIHSRLSDAQLIALFEAIIIRGNVQMFTKFQKRYKLKKMRELMEQVTVARRREYFMMIAIGGHTSLFENFRMFWTDFVDKYADVDGMVYQSTYHAHIDMLNVLRKMYSGELTNLYYSIALDAANKAHNKKMIEYVKSQAPEAPVSRPNTLSKVPNGAHYSVMYSAGSADADDNWRSKK
jgi:hypothetical protein